MSWIRPKLKSPSFQVNSADSSVELGYTIGDETDEDAALILLATTAPSFYLLNGIVLSKVEYSVTPTSHDMYDGTARYTKRSREREELQEGESSFQFETGGGSIHVTHALSTTKYGGANEPDINNAIDFDGETIKGTDIQSPVYNFSETHIVPAATVTSAYKLALFRATGKTNNASYKGFDAGEVLFLGASGSKRGDDAWEINYRHSAQENKTGLSIGGIAGISKKGWEFLWVKWSSELVPATGRVKPKAAAVYVQKVYEDHDFANLLIGT